VLDKRTAQAIAAETADPGMVFLEYIGGNAGNSSWWGPETRTRYIFGGGRPIGQVHAEDAPGMLNIRHHTKPVFRRWQPPAAGRKVPALANAGAAGMTDVPESAAQVANPTEPDNLTEIKGIGNATAGKLAAGGYTTFVALARSTAERVAQDTGIAPRLAEAAVAGAQERVGGDWRDRLGDA
jgi:predicted flap endonuclease-1-like 5' DNA nuclease